MKAKEAHKLLEGYGGNDLFQEASKLYRLEVDSVITTRSHGKQPSSNLIDGAIKQVNDWFKKVAKGLPWDKPELPESIIEWERGKVWVKYGMVDPVLLDWGKRTQMAILKGKPLPILEAMKPGDLEAASSIAMARIQESLKIYEELEERKRIFATQMGKKLCPYGVEERFCPHSSTFSLTGGIPTSIEDLVFVCTIDKCIKEE